MSFLLLVTFHRLGEFCSGLNGTPQRRMTVLLVALHPEVFFVEGNGSWLRDVHDREYLVSRSVGRTTAWMSSI